jgi:predicted permease
VTEPRAPRKRPLTSRAAADDVRRELEFHIEMRATELMKAGLDRETALTEARRCLGDAAQLERSLTPLAESRDRRLRWWAWLSDARVDLLDAVRRLRRAPAFAIGTIAILAIGVGANSAVFSLASTSYLRPLPFPNEDRVVRVQEYRNAPDGSLSWLDASAPTLQAMRDSGMFTAAAALRPVSLALTSGESSERIEVGEVTEGWSGAVGLTPALGRMFTDAEEHAGDAADVVVISHRLWQSAFGGRQDVLGQRLRLDGGSREIVGVLPAGYAFPYLEDAWWPTQVAINTRGYFLWGRLKPGITLAEANRRLDAIAPALLHDYPDVLRSLRPRARVIRDVVIGDQGRVVMLLGWSVAVLMLLVGTNIAMLLLTRLASRQRELAVRAALGCGVSRQARLLTMESLVLTMAGGATGLVLTLALRSGLSQLLPSNLTTQLGAADTLVDWRVIGFTIALASAAGMLLGAGAAWRASRLNLATAFRESARTGSTASRRVLGALVTIELALSAALAAVALTVGLELYHLQSRDVGFPTASLLTFHVELQADRFRVADARLAIVNRFETELMNTPGATAVGISTVNPLCCGDWGAAFAVEGQPVTVEAANMTNWRLVTPSFFKTLGVRLIDGRGFDEHDGAVSEPVAIVDQRLANRYWPGGHAVGQRMKRGWTGSTNPWVRIVGVVSAVDDAGDYSDTWYMPYLQNPLGPSGDELHVWVRTTNAAAAADIRAIGRRVDPALPLIRLTTMDEIKREELAQRRLGTRVAVLFACASTLLALCGVYALVAFAVAREKREMGIRLALGATGGQVVRQVVGRMLRLGLVGVAAGVLVVRAMQPQLAAALDARPVAFWPIASVVAVGLILAVIVAAMVPARRIRRIDPARTLSSS